MKKSATDVMQEALFAAVVDAIVALTTRAQGLPNTLVREVNAIHPNTAFGDLPKELQAAITASTRAALTRLMKEGYTVASKDAPPPPRPAPGPSGAPRPFDRGRPGGKPGPGGGRPGPGGNRGRGPRPPRP